MFRFEAKYGRWSKKNSNTRYCIVFESDQKLSKEEMIKIASDYRFSINADWKIETVKEL